MATAATSPATPRRSKPSTAGCRSLIARLKPGDLVVITADHGNDPTFRGTDHTREHVPILAFGPGIAGGVAGRRDTLADIGETVAAHLALAPGRHGKSFLPPRK